MGNNNARQEAAKKALFEKWRIADTYPVEKACPFCGRNRAIVEQDKEHNDLYLVKCRECYAVTPRAPTPDEAIKLWNEEQFPDYVWLTNKEVPYITDSDVWDELKNAVVIASFAKYKQEKKMAMKSWRNGSAYADHIEKANEEKHFFLSPGFALFSDVSGESIIKTADKQAAYDVKFREPNHCRGCGNSECNHQKYIWWLWDSGNKYDTCIGWKKQMSKKGKKLWTNPHLYPLEPR